MTTPQDSATSSASFGMPLGNVAVTGLWPSVAKPSQIVFIFGGGFVYAATRAAVNGVDAPILQVIDPSLMWFLVPPTATSGPVTVTTPNGSVTSASTITIR